MNDILIGRNDSTAADLDPRFGNRHGMIHGATGTISAVRNIKTGFANLGNQMNRRARSGIPGLSFSWRRVLGISGVKASLSRKAGIPPTESGLERKVGRSIFRGLVGGIFGGKR